MGLDRGPHSRLTRTPSTALFVAIVLVVGVGSWVLEREQPRFVHSTVDVPALTRALNRSRQRTGHLDQGRALRQHVGGQRVSEPMCADAWHTRPSTRSTRDVADQVRPDRPPRGFAGQEHLTDRGRRSGPAQISGQRLTNLARQRQTIQPAGLAAHDDLPGPPIDVVQFQTCDFDRTQAETGHQDQDREVTHRIRCAAIAGVEQPVHLRW